MHLEEKTVSSKEIFNGKVFRVTEEDALLENGEQVKREVVHHNGGVTVIPVTEQNEIIMVKQYRYAQHKVLLEIPAGKLEKGEYYIAGDNRQHSYDSREYGPVTKMRGKVICRILPNPMKDLSPRIIYDKK